MPSKRSAWRRTTAAWQTTAEHEREAEEWCEGLIGDVADAD
jgi:hypothetical protein